MSVATSKALRFCFLKCRANLAEAVVFPVPCKPAIRTIVGGWSAFTKGALVSPITCTSSSWTILINCWSGLTPVNTFAPFALMLTSAIKSLTTCKFTSASNRARRTSRRAS